MRATTWHAVFAAVLQLTVGVSYAAIAIAIAIAVAVTVAVGNLTYLSCFES